MSCTGVSSFPASVSLSQEIGRSSTDSERIRTLLTDGKVKTAAALLKNLAATKDLSIALAIINEIPSHLQGTISTCQQAVVKGLLSANKDAEAEGFTATIEDDDDRSDALVLFVEKFVAVPSKLDDAIRIYHGIVNQYCRESAKEGLVKALKACGREEDAAKLSHDSVA